MLLQVIKIEIPRNKGGKISGHMSDGQDEDDDQYFFEN